MKRKILTVLLVLFITFSLKAQVPEHIKTMLKELVTKVDGYVDTEKIKSEIGGFLSNAPNEELKKAAIEFIKTQSKSEAVKKVISNLSNNKKEPEHASYLFLKNATIIDVISKASKPGSILIKDDRIEDINYSGNLEIPQGAIIYDLTGKYIMPGLIDAHVHITHGTEAEAREQLEIGLKNGVTGVRDMGGDGRMLTSLKKKMAIGEEQGADVYFSTIIAGPTFFKDDPRPQQVAKGAIAGEVSWQRAITTETDFKQIVAEAKGLGATAIKMYANLDKDLIKKVSDEAKKQGLKVWAHAAIPPSRPTDVVLGGAEVISHAGDMLVYEIIDTMRDRHSFKSKEESGVYRKKLNSMQWNENTKQVNDFFSLMKQKNTILDATLNVYSYGLDKPINGAKIDSSRYFEAMNATKAAYKAGVKIGAGSDNMVDILEDGEKAVRIHRELELLVKAGLSTMDALRAATIINAEGLGDEKNIGSVDKGKLANLVILNENPVTDIKNTTNIKYVFKRGILVK